MGRRTSEPHVLMTDPPFPVVDWKKVVLKVEEAASLLPQANSVGWRREMDELPGKHLLSSIELYWVSWSTGHLKLCLIFWAWSLSHVSLSQTVTRSFQFFL